MKSKIEQILMHLESEQRTTHSLFLLKLNFLTNRQRLFDAFNRIISWDSIKDFPDCEETFFYLIDTKEIDLPIVFDIPEGYTLQKSLEHMEFYSGKDDPGKFFIRLYENIRFYIDLEKNFIFGALVLGETYSEDFLAQFIIFPILNFILRRKGFYSIHSGGISRDGNAAIFPAEKESGKSTLSIYLAREGFDYLSDETVFGNLTGNKARLFGFPRQIKLYNDAIDFFPELEPVIQPGSSHPARYKVRFPVRDIFSFKIESEALPRFIIFPEKTSSFSLNKVTKPEALRLIVPESLEFISKEIAESYLEFIHNLVKESETFKLNSGRDLSIIKKELEEMFK